MLQVFKRHHHTHAEISDYLLLDQDTRKKARIKSKTAGGLDIGIFIERGNPLKIGEILESECGQLIEVKGQAESVATAIANDWLTFSKVCYHLGNRHTTLQIGELWVRFKPDHVLEELAQMFGLNIEHHDAIFEPEQGAYGTYTHKHSHD